MTDAATATLVYVALAVAVPLAVLYVIVKTAVRNAIIEAEYLLGRSQTANVPTLRRARTKVGPL